MTAATSRLETNALLAALRVAHPRVGDAVAPADTTLPYAVLYPAGSGPLDGPMTDPNADRMGLQQITCVGSSREQVEWLADKLRLVALAPLTISGRVVMQASLETSQPVRRDDSAAPAVFYGVDQYRFLTTPS